VANENGIATTLCVRADAGASANRVQPLSIVSGEDQSIEPGLYIAFSLPTSINLEPLGLPTQVEEQPGHPDKITAGLRPAAKTELFGRNILPLILALVLPKDWIPM
jgi:hypothetical protein